MIVKRKIADYYTYLRFFRIIVLTYLFNRIRYRKEVITGRVSFDDVSFLNNINDKGGTL